MTFGIHGSALEKDVAIALRHNQIIVTAADILMYFTNIPDSCRKEFRVVEKYESAV